MVDNPRIDVDAVVSSKGVSDTAGCWVNWLEEQLTSSLLTFLARPHLPRDDRVLDHLHKFVDEIAAVLHVQVKPLDHEVQRAWCLDQ